MFKRLMLIGALVISVVAMSGTHANAQFFDGWGWFGFSAVKGEIDLHGIPNPDTNPTIVIVDAIVDSVEFYCKNPNDSTTPAQPGTAGKREIIVSDQLDDDNHIDKKKGTGHSTIFLDISNYDHDPNNCVNPNWKPIIGSAAVKKLSIMMSSFRCIGPKADPCSVIADKPRDTVGLFCTLDEVVRNPDLTTVSDDPNTPEREGSEFACIEQ